MVTRSVKISILSVVLIIFLACSTIAWPDIVGDLDSSFSVDFQDLWILANQWLDPDCHTSGCIADLDGVPGVNIGDFALLANNWQKVELRLLISEFMASNDSQPPLDSGELLDGNEESSDWIEIYNPTDAAVILDGWYLTDNDANLTKWQFPNGLEIEPGGFLIVFASDKKEQDYPYRDPEDYYHTNFNIDKQAGKYLALVAPDGVTVVHEYEYPDQLTDVSYGLAQSAEIIVAPGAAATYRVPTSGDASLGTGWTETGFNDLGWDTGSMGIGFGVSGTVDEDLIAHYEFEGNLNDSSGYGRDGTPFGDIGFETDPIRGQVLSLPGGSNQYVLIGGVGISGTMPRTIACWAKADHTAIPDWTLIFGFTTVGGGCGSHFNIGSLGGPGGVGAHTWCWEETIFTDEQALEWRHYAMTYDGSTVRYYGDGVLMDTDPAKSNVQNLVHADNIHIGSRATQDSSFPGKVDDARIYDRLLSDEEIVNVMSGSTINTDVETEMKNVNSSLWTRIEFEVEDPAFFDILTLRMKYEDGFFAYLNGQKVAQGNAPNSVAWNSAALSDRPVEESSDYENFNIMSYLDLLLPKPQKNVLAIHGLNDNKNDGEFLILPELVIAKNQTIPEYFSTATPGTFNISGANDVVSEVWFSHERSFRDSSFYLTLSTRTEGAEIRYTLDGSRPTSTHGDIYVLPLLIDHTTTLRAVAVKPGYLDSDIKTHTYIFVSDVINQSPNGEAPGPGWPTGSVNGQILNYGMDPDVVVTDPRYIGVVDDALLAIPSFSLVTDLAHMFDPSTGIWVNAGQEGRGWERPVSVELIHPNGSDGFQIDAGMRIRGGYSVSGSNPKHAFRLFFRAIYGGHYGEGKLRYPLFGNEGVSEFDNMDLRCSQNYSWAFSGDTANTMVREVFSRDVQGMTGSPYTKSRFYHLYFNGHYWGLFQTQERSEASYGESYFGGDKLDYDVISSNWSAGRQMVPTDGNRESLDRLYYETIAGFDNYERYYRVQGMNIDGTPYTGPDPNYERLLDVENLIDFMIIEYYTGDRDGPGSRFGGIPNNTWCIYNRVNPDGYKWFHHDNEHTLGAGAAEENMVTPFTTAGAQIQYFNPQWLHEQLMFTNVDYRIHFADHVHRHFFNDGLLTLDEARKHIQTRANQIDMAIIAESARWGDSKVHPPRTKDDTWLPELNRLLNSSDKRCLPLRVGVVLDQLKSVGWYPSLEAPSFNQHGGEVAKGFGLTMSAPAGTIYYTTDGNDPRISVAQSSSGSAVTFVAENDTKYVLVPTGSLAGPPGTILREYWTGITGQAVSDLTSNPDYPGNPTAIDYLTSFEAPVNWAEHYGTRIRGFLHPPADGSYNFWISTDDNGELWLSTDENPANITRIAHVPGWSNSREWDKYTEQKTTVPISLNAGQKYYIEALQKEHEGGDNLAVTWEGGGITKGNPIEGQYLSPAGETWATNYFDHSGWPSGTGGVGYERSPGDPVNYTGLFNINVEAGMYGNNSTCYIRIPFNASHTDLADLTLRMKYDDAFVAFINGVEVKRKNFTGVPQWNSDANDQNADTSAVNFEDFDISGHINALQPGNNILAIHGMNISTTSTDFLISVELVGTQISQGDVSPGAAAYGGQIALNKSTLVKSRAWNGGAWSALNEAAFAVGPIVENLRITEIMYRPKNTGDPNDPNEEYIELANTGTEKLNLNLVKFTEGIHYTFPDIELAAGEHIVVVKNRSAFEAQYGTSLKIAEGQYAGSLANNGERIRLEDAIGRTILDFEYKDGWYPITDGDGFSLTMINPSDSSIYGSEEGLTAHWKFDEGMGGIASDSAGSNIGFLVGDTSWTSGRIGGALSFDGAGDYVAVSSISALAGDTFTAQAWVRVDASAPTWNAVMTQHDGSNNGCYFYIANGSPAFYLVDNPSSIQVVSPQTLNADQWYHVAATYDGSELKLYVDGLLKDDFSSAGLTGASANAYIGLEFDSPLYYKGLIDDVRMYNRAVSASEFQDLTDPMGRWSRKGSWRASAYRNGSPGADDSGILPNPGAVVINEVMSHSNTGPDWVELYNTTNEAINIGGWFLSDSDSSDPCLMKYRIADGTIIDPNSYMVFYQDANFNNPNDPGYNVPFGYSENEEVASLSSYIDSNGFLTGYREVEDFGAAQTNVSFGRYYKSSTGNFNFVAMDSNTPGWLNDDPKVGPIVINEIMYNPSSGNQTEEYIELYNILPFPVTLYRVDKSMPWKFTDGIDYTFSGTSFVTIPAFGYLLVVKDKTSFNTRYGSIVPPGVKVVGSYDGWLSNAGETLELGVPGDVDIFGTRHYIRLDRVKYSDGLHHEDNPGGIDLWPREADGIVDGLGKSLSRKDPFAYGNDVINWKAADPSPGSPNPP